MKKLITSVVLSISFFTVLPLFTVFPPTLDNQALRTDVSSINNLPKVANYVYWHHGHRWVLVQMASLALLLIFKIQSIKYLK
ncbi:hypothetical protein [Legionella tucsonensis]|uniref:Uncharacterized protein n=1 Tax=Legionella tucsonensis TaxID=40335 RepID=A0A0W0ZPT7_9GAMM|nr:hypothetical protein [Legionella tucsonensis]KTD70910.1 hypothetical protein Ltuc_2921 [Legionella tucsonensis]